MATRNASYCVSCRLPAQLPDEGRCKRAGLCNEPLINFSLRPLQRSKVIGFSRAAPSAGRDPPDFIAPKHHRAMHERPQQAGFFPRSVRFGGSGSEHRLGEINE